MRSLEYVNSQSVSGLTIVGEDWGDSSNPQTCFNLSSFTEVVLHAGWAFIEDFFGKQDPVLR